VWHIFATLPGEMATRASAADSSASLARAIEAVSRGLGRGRRLAERLRHPDLAALRSLLDDLTGAIETLNRAAGLDAGDARLARNTVLHGSFPVLLLLRQGEVEAATSRLLRLWQEVLQGFGWADADIAALGSEVAEPRHRMATESREDAEILPLFNVALFGRLTEEESQERDRWTLARLAELLHLSLDQLGRMLGVSGETVRRWMQGSHRVPEERSAQVALAEVALGRMLEIFRPERLFQVVRRKADLFDGESALEWILRGRVAEVADRYELALSYQG